MNFLYEENNKSKNFIQILIQKIRIFFKKLFKAIKNLLVKFKNLFKRTKKNNIEKNTMDPQYAATLQNFEDKIDGYANIVQNLTEDLARLNTKLDSLSSEIGNLTSEEANGEKGLKIQKELDHVKDNLNKTHKVYKTYNNLLINSQKEYQKFINNFGH